MDWVLYSWSGKRAVLFCQVGFWRIKNKFVIHKAEPANSSEKVLIHPYFTQIKEVYLCDCTQNVNLKVKILREVMLQRLDFSFLFKISYLSLSFLTYKMEI